MVTPRSAFNDFQANSELLGASIVNLSWIILRCTHSLTTAREARCEAMGSQHREGCLKWYHVVSRGLQRVPLALLLLHDQNYMVWCHGGHETSCSSCENIVLTAHASPRLATTASTRGCGRLTSHSAGGQKGCHLFGGDERQAGTTTMTDLQVLARCVPPLAYPPNLVEVVLGTDG